VEAGCNCPLRALRALRGESIRPATGLILCGLHRFAYNRCVTRLHLGPNTELLIAERSLGMPAAVLGLAAGVSAYFWLRRKYNVTGIAARLGLLAATLIGGVIVVGGLIIVAGLLAPAFGWICAAAALVAVLMISYLHGTKGATLGSATWLLVLRLLAIGVLVLLYFEPQLKLVDRNVHRSKLLLMIDESGSMKINDGPAQTSRLEWVTSELLRKDGPLDQLEKNFEVKIYAFSDRLRPLDKGRAEIGALRPKGRATTFAPTVGHVCREADALTTTGALLFTDGIDNSGHDPVDLIARTGLPVFPVAVGSRLREKGDFKDIAVSRVDYERHIARDNKSEITAHIDGVGLKGRRVTVKLMFDGKEKDSRPLALDDLPGTQMVKLAFTPADKGTFKCSVEVTVDPEERITDNNKKEFDLVVTEPAIKVLLVEGVIRAEYKWLVRTLQMDPNTRLLALVQVRRGVFNQQGNFKEVTLNGFPTSLKVLQKFDIIIFGDIDRSHFSAEQLRNIQKFVEAGGGFVMTGGYSTLGPGGYAGTPVETILPVRLVGRDVGQEKDPFKMTLSVDGARHPMFSGIEPFFPTMSAKAKRALPDLLGCTRVGAIKPGATTLAVHPSRTGPDGEPLVVAAVQPYGQGFAMVFTADTTWRWYLGLRGLGRDTPYIRFWGQTMRWLASEEVKQDKGEKGVIAYTDRRYYEPGATVRIYARVHDKDGQATNQAEVTAYITGPAGTPGARQIPHIPGSTGKYEVDFQPPTPGDYTMSVKAELSGEAMGEAKKTEFRVGRPNLEFDKLDLDDKMLRRLADKTQGKYVTMVGLDNFIKKLRSTEEAKGTIRSVDVWSDESITLFGQDMSLYLIIAFTLFSALVTAEWVLRRRKQLI
jgi:uncharacterized membrane protein